MKFLIMDHTGHTEELYAVDDKAEVKRAMDRFDELMKLGNAPAKLDKATGKHTVNRSFDPTAEEYTFVPPLKGG